MENFYGFPLDDDLEDERLTRREFSRAFDSWHGEYLRKWGVDKWNRFRSHYPSLNARLGNVDLSGLQLDHIDLHKAELMDAKLIGTKLEYANLREANLSRANLSESILYGVDLTDASFEDTDFSNAKFGNTILPSLLKFRGAKGLETVEHFGPSKVDIKTLDKVVGIIPDIFLQGLGMPKAVIDSYRIANEADLYFSCFISYSSKDHAFAQRLYADLQSKGVNCWFAPEDLKIGEKIRPTIDESIIRHDRLLLMLSEHSVASQWVEQEVETALAREREEKRTILFPIRLDNALTKVTSGWPALIQNTRHIGNFEHWKNYEEYQKAFSRLLRDLKHN